MEFVGRMFERDFNGSAVKGFVDSYDESSRLFKVSYENGNTEELSLSQVSCQEYSDSEGSLQRQKKGSAREDDGVSAMQVERKEIGVGFEKDQIEASNNGVTPNQVVTSGKRRKQTPKMVSASAISAIRRKCRRSRAAKKRASIGERTHADSKVLQSSVLNNVGKPETSDQESEDSDDDDDGGGGVVPAILHLPTSSKKLNLDGMPVFDLFSIYAFLRSFSTILFLSPFEFEAFVSSLKFKAPNQLIDAIHVSLLQTLRKHLEFLSGENSLSASNCLRSLNWDLLDLVTWPIFLVEYFLMHGSALSSGFDIRMLKSLYENDYYEQPDQVKIEILRYLCDDVIETESITSEINKRSMAIDPNMDSERNAKFELSSRKRKIDVSENSYLGEKVDEDGNIDECCLCKMDGSLICCDSCPAAYHLKCVGIASSDLPDGDWYCHECLIDKKNPGKKLGKPIRGTEVLGVDPHERLYYSCCGYLLVFDPYGDEPKYHYYCPEDVILVVHVLKTLQRHYNKILQAIAREWNICIASVGSKINCIELREQMPVVETTNIVMKMEISSSPGEADGREILNTPNGSFESAFVANGGNYNHKMDMIGAINGDRLQEQLETGYLNFYSFALRASTVVEELARRKSSDKAGEASLKSKEDVISVQLKAISRISNKFFWPNIPNLSVGARKENCGWCFSCRSTEYGGDCFFNMNNSGPSMENFTSMAVGLCSQQLGAKGHVADVACYILFMEDRLLGLLSGPWLNPHYSKFWRQSLLKATNMSDLKHLLLLLELNLNQRAFSAEWLKQVDTVSTMGSACHIVINTEHVSLKYGFVRKRGRPSLMETTVSSNTSDGLRLLWWRGGKVSQHLFNWKVLPRSMASKAARRASCTMIPDLSYSDGPDFLKRSKRIAWQAAIESSTSVDQMALQVRELDANIRWDEIENTTCLLSKGVHLRKIIRQPFNKVIVRRKLIEGTVAKYLLDFGKRKCIPEIVLSHGVIFEESFNDKKKYWLEESYVPLHLLKKFEHKKSFRKSNDISSRERDMFASIRNKQQRKDVFSYLFSKAEKAESNKCGECAEDVLIREAVSCHQCKDLFHKIHARTSHGAENGTFTCKKCITEEKQAVMSGKDSVLSKVSEETSEVKKPVKSIRVKASAVQKQMIVGQKRGRTAKSKGRWTPTKKENSTWKRRRTIWPRVYWLNGVQLSEVPNDERLLNFRTKQLIKPSDPASAILAKPKCGLCRERRFTSTLTYLACGTCKGWFHGDAFGLDEEKIGRIIGFKCHRCLKPRVAPVCPHHP
ncbi:DDT domain-containing protein PTM-like [Impatiens glandulifera]|uniref:DDT domain-containing protein PTM-like n=1 Tax=Impatiens glandulifera TaxID=253017 RepID=UPI001FB0AF1B|nr:DDT domain-containing protein PTM-like [Impatiens glandulifera]